MAWPAGQRAQNEMGRFRAQRTRFRPSEAEGKSRCLGSSSPFEVATQQTAGREPIVKILGGTDRLSRGSAQRLGVDSNARFRAPQVASLVFWLNAGVFRWVRRSLHNQSLFLVLGLLAGENADCEDR
jgi:hypothetical protein